MCPSCCVGYAYEEMSEISPDHKFLAYTMYDKDNDYFKLCVRNLYSGALCSKPHADRVSNIAWAKNGQALLYVVTDQKKRPFRFSSLINFVDCLVSTMICLCEIVLYLLFFYQDLL